jgi:hypothetical protein
MMMRRRVALLLAAAILVPAAACSDDQAPAFAIEGNGDIAGQIFFDADNNGRFTPLSGDTVLRGLPVTLRARADTTTLATTTTDIDGQFSFTDVAPGTHELVVESEDAGGLAFCSLPANTSVYIGEQTFVRIPAKRGCVIRIEEAKDVGTSQSATVAGVVTAGQGTFAGNVAYVQDPTGGIMLFGLPSTNLQLGDSIEVTGILTLFNGELELTSPVVAPNRRTGAEVPAPADRTIKEITDAGNAAGQGPDVGRLVRIRKVTVGAFTSGGNNNANMTDATGTMIIRTDGNAATSIPKSTFVAGRCYDITGILGYFNAFQLKPRTVQDVQEVPCT